MYFFLTRFWIAEKLLTRQQQITLHSPFYFPLKNVSLVWRRHHFRWRAARFRPMLGAQGLWAGREDVTTAGEGLQNLDLCLALRAFEQGGIFIVPHLLWHGGSIFPVLSEGPPHSVASYDTQGNEDDLFLSCFSRVKCPILTAVT
jgi:hypothetical protein